MGLPLLLPNSHFQESLTYILSRSLFCLFNIWSRKRGIQNPLSHFVWLPRGTGTLGAGRGRVELSDPAALTGARFCRRT